MGYCKYPPPQENFGYCNYHNPKATVGCSPPPPHEKWIYKEREFAFSSVEFNFEQNLGIEFSALQEQSFRGQPSNQLKAKRSGLSPPFGSEYPGSRKTPGGLRINRKWGRITVGDTVMGYCTGVAPPLPRNTVENFLFKQGSTSILFILRRIQTFQFECSDAQQNLQNACSAGSRAHAYC